VVYTIKIYSLAFLASFIPLTIIIIAWFKLKDKNKVLAYGITIGIFIFAIMPLVMPGVSPSWQNDSHAFVDHKMEPLNLWMIFHMVFWVVWMWLPGILGLFLSEKDMLKLSVVAWPLFLIILFITANTGKLLWVSFPAR